MRPRLISKENAKVIADAGGVIGAWTHLAGSVDEYAGNIRALVDVVGVDHVGIGTDTKLAKPAGAGGGRGRGPGGDRTNQAWPDLNGGFYNGVAAALRKQGFTPDEVGKIGGGNFCRVFDAVTTVSTPD